VINSTLLQASTKLADWRSVMAYLLRLRSSVAGLPPCTWYAWPGTHGTTSTVVPPQRHGFNRHLWARLRVRMYRTALVSNSTTRTDAHITQGRTDEHTQHVVQLVVQQFATNGRTFCHIPTSWHVEMLGCGKMLCVFVRSSVGGVRVVEFDISQYVRAPNSALRHRLKPCLRRYNEPVPMSTG